MVDNLKLKQEMAVLREEGFVVVRGLVDAKRCAALRNVAETQLAVGAAPLEYEADLRYPGAPTSRQAAGGETVRRLLDAYGRDALFREWAVTPQIAAWMERYWGEPAVLSRAHHNCIMTKHPAYGSLTGWHRDARYWSFERDDLISVWLALGPEKAENGALWFVPKSHRLQLSAERFDQAKFFRAEQPENIELMQTACSTELAAGDVVFFHCNTLHSAGPNKTDAVKFSLVFTYHGVSNPPLPNSRSAAQDEVALVSSRT
ncbi:phytanoyl-CoA dioxygenase [Mycoavidus cysteinexigens]|uniref:Phytanoyl-CoA dioxygenase n=1 Tax=Mycoavidus cysteinexigens TaxID=1553431 RepID=A0A2Z6EYA2_9BURK|nr:phytanoyl-CoA dioxygenase family protein [Mycoavidus cysteinexigens]BBE10348.1 phytanoyl-CoA dioxygenase [Mycoavidus cysteinexigens]GAM53279.1 protein involved in biosynthesis of mitomycin antibiotics/polyketide fumonisin [bacterium endosymbiont of Mortierella elongata FMR23-6]GLR00765.1 phytanoyl-CoA dioxygenase [Mycoavidus cysteinexigens]